MTSKIQSREEDSNAASDIDIIALSDEDHWNLAALSPLLLHLRNFLETLKVAANGMAYPPGSYKPAMGHLGRFGLWLDDVDSDTVSLAEILAEDSELADVVIHLLMQLVGYVVAEYSYCK